MSQSRKKAARKKMTSIVSPTMTMTTALLAIFLLPLSAGNPYQNYRALKFGNAASDYIVYQPNMAPLQNAFSVCFWARSLRRLGHCGPHIISYEGNGFSNEIIVSDEGGCNHIFGSNFDLSSKHSVPSGTWFHYCYTWSYSSLTQKVYLNGQLIGSRSTPSGRTLRDGGYLMLGNDAGYNGRSMSDSYIFGGELYKLNLFSKELSSSEVLEMSRDKCTETELTYGDVRSIKWEELLQRSRNGNVREIDSGCNAETGRLWVRLSETLEELRNSSQLLNETKLELREVKEEKDLCRTNLATSEENLNTTMTKVEEALEELERKKEDLIRITTSLNQTQTELDQVRKLLEKANNTPPDCPLNTTITSYWDLLYSEDYFGDVISSEKLEVLYKSVEKLGKC